MKQIFVTTCIFIILCNILYSQQNCNIPFPGTFNEIFNIKSFGAFGDGKENDTPSIQAALDSIKNRVINCGKGGTIYFPPGIYLINRPLKIPPKCHIIGLSGVFTQAFDWQVDYSSHQPIVIKLARGSNCNMLEPYQMELTGGKYNDYENVIIQGINLDGNKSEQSNIEKKCGICVPDRESAMSRPNFILRDLMIFNVKGDGFYGGKNQGEYTFEKVCSKRNTGNGFYFNKAEDIAFEKVWAAENGEDGFHIETGGAMRFVNCDSWGNANVGTYLFNSGACYFDILQSSYNFKHGVIIKECWDINFISAIFYGNSRENWDIPSPTYPKYSEVLLISNINGFGSYGIKFVACRFGQTGNGIQSKYAIYDSSANLFNSYPQNNSLIGCMFVENRFKNGICNHNVFNNYIFEGCTGGEDGSTEINNPSYYTFYNSVIQTSAFIQPKNHIIRVNSESRDFFLTLPDLKAIPVGKEYIVIKDHSENSVFFRSVYNQLINNSESPIIFTGDAYSQIKLINAGDSWLIIK